MTMKNKLKILIVEDEIFTAKSLKMDLENLGMTVLQPVAKGEDAIEIALKEEPSLIFMDIRLAGGLDGIEVVEQIHLNKKIPVLFMSGYATEYIQERARKVDYLAFIEKPVSVSTIKKILETFDN